MTEEDAPQDDESILLAAPIVIQHLQDISHKIQHGDYEAAHDKIAELNQLFDKLGIPESE